MRKIVLSAIAALSMSSFAIAGGSVAPIVVPIVAEEEDSSHFYIGAGLVYNQVYSTDYGHYDDSVLTQDETGAWAGIVGYEFNEYLAFEGRFNKTFADRDYSDTTYYSLFLKPQYKFRDEENRNDEDGYITVYGLLGYGNTKVEGSDGDNNHYAWPENIGRTMMDESGFQWGIGLSYTFVDDSNDDRYTRKDSWSIFADFVSVVKDADIEPTRLYDYGDGTDATYYDKLSVRAFTLGVLYHF